MMRALILAIAIIASGPAAALAQTSGDQDGKSELWGESDRGEDKGRVKATGSSYNTTHIAYASIVMVLMGGFLIWLIRRHREP